MKIKIVGATKSLLENTDQRQDGLFEFGAKVMGVCVNNEPLEVMKNETLEKTQKRLLDTIKLRHHSGYDFEKIAFVFEDTSKVFMTYLNNLHIYDTEETSGRHVELKMKPKEQEVFDYFYKAFYDKACEKNPDAKEHVKKQIAFENARFVSGVDVKTNMVHQVSLRQFNYICEWAEKFLKKEKLNPYEELVKPEMKEFLSIANTLEIDGQKLRNESLKDPYNREFNLFFDGKKRPEHFGKTYEIYYPASYSAFAQLQRHRGINYQIAVPEKTEYYVPPIVKEMELEGEWKEKIDGIGNLPQARLVDVCECGTYDQFVMKMKERCCNFAQEEIRDITKKSATKIFEGMKSYDENLANELIERYGNGKNRRDFPDYKCVCRTPCKPYSEKVEGRKL